VIDFTVTSDPLTKEQADTLNQEEIDNGNHTR
jgi:hypothetical protein